VRTGDSPVSNAIATRSARAKTAVDGSKRTQVGRSVPTARRRVACGCVESEGDPWRPGPGTWDAALSARRTRDARRAVARRPTLDARIQSSLHGKLVPLRAGAAPARGYRYAARSRQLSWREPSYVDPDRERQFTREPIR